MIEDALEVTLALVDARAPEATVRPSEVARAMVDAAGTQIAASNWRSAMPVVHAAVDRLVAQGEVRLSWKGEALATRVGPYRIGRRKIV